MRRFRELSLRTQLLLLTILLTLPSLGIITFNGYEKRKDDIHQTAIETQKLADNIAAELEHLTHETHKLGELIAHLPEVKQQDTSKVRSILATILKDNPQYLALLIADRSGTVWASSNPADLNRSVADRRYFKNALASKRFSSGEYVTSMARRMPTLAMGYPLINERGEFDGVIVLSYNLDLLKPLLERAQLPKDTNYVIVDHKGIIISRGHDATGHLGTSLKPDVFKSMEARPDKATYEYDRIDGDKRITTHRKLWLSGEQKPYLYVRTGISYKTAVAATYREISYNSALLIPFVIIAFALVFYLGKRSIVDRITILDSAARQLAKGSLTGKIGDQVKGGELGSLGETFDDMAQKLKSREQLLIEKTQMLADLNDNLEQRVLNAVKELRQKDQILIQQSRLAVMGEMINNIAHQWRQPLNNIGLIVQNLELCIKGGDLNENELCQEIDNVMNIIEFMSNTIDDFRNFFRQDKQKRRFNVNKAVEGVIEFISASLKNSNILVEQVADEKVFVIGYRNEYTQVLLNILSNSRDVLLERNICNPCIRINLCSNQDNSILIVSDNGGGIQEDILPQIFDPYFTTKEPGKGTGIGLYMSKVIIEQNMNGKLTACNSGEGAEFRIEV